ncbi:MAG: ATP-binding protein [Cyanobacteria bacterium P01_F01_bin.86]
MTGIDHSIYKKISFGYILALGTAIFGTSFGLLASHYYAQTARSQKQQMQQKKQLLSDFNSRLLQIQTHPLRLLAIAGESRIWVEYETNQFGTDLRKLNRLLDEMEQLATASSLPHHELIDLVNRYRKSLRVYEEFASILSTSVEGIDEKRIATENLSAALGSTYASELSTTFEQLSEDLTRLQQTIDQNYDQANTQLQRVESLSLGIILGSMVASIGLAIALAMITSRAIASPIEQLTKVAHRVTHENNFQLQVPIQTRDEVSLLAKAINQLVSWAGQYTQELEEAQQTLEKRVEDRTKALRLSEVSLRYKAEDLQQALDELQQTQLQLIQSEKMSSLGQMVAGVAHEINNPISFIHGNLKHAIEYTDEIMRLLDQYQSSYPTPNSETQSLIEEIDLPFLREDFAKLLQSMQDGTERICDIVKSLKTFSRLDEAAVKAVDLNDGLESTLTILGNRLKADSHSSGIRVIRNFGSLPLIECYAGQLNQVFMNILSNAIDALEAETELPDPLITITTQIFDSDWVVIEIADNGPGIPERVRNRLFDPFFTTKAVGKGTGLGLSISYQIVTETHRGYLECESALGEGSKFTIKLPIKCCDYIG